MPVKLFKKTPPPVPQPPPTFSLEGLSEQQIRWLRDAVKREAEAMRSSFSQSLSLKCDFLNRVDRVLGGNAEEKE
jgi:hypothetical protein